MSDTTQPVETVIVNRLDPDLYCRRHGAKRCDPMPLTGTTCVQCHEEFVSRISCTCHDLTCPNRGVILSQAEELFLCCYVSARLSDDTIALFERAEPMSDSEIEAKLSRRFGIYGDSCGPGTPSSWHKGGQKPTFCYEPLRIDLTVKLSGSKLVEVVRNLHRIPMADGVRQMSLFGLT